MEPEDEMASRLEKMTRMWRIPQVPEAETDTGGIHRQDHFLIGRITRCLRRHWIFSTLKIWIQSKWTLVTIKNQTHDLWIPLHSYQTSSSFLLISMIERATFKGVKRRRKRSGWMNTRKTFTLWGKSGNDCEIYWLCFETKQKPVCVYVCMYVCVCVYWKQNL